MKVDEFAVISIAKDACESVMLSTLMKTVERSNVLAALHSAIARECLIYRIKAGKHIDAIFLQSLPSQSWAVQDMQLSRC